MAQVKQDVYFNEATGKLQLAPCTGYVYLNAGMDVTEVAIKTLEREGIALAEDGSVSEIAKKKEAKEATAKKGE